MKYAIIAFALISTSVQAQEYRNYIGPGGEYLGQSRSNGDTTSYYGPGGLYYGQSRTNDSTTSYYGPGGQYYGQSREFGSGE